jgi:hypothetical protein
VSKEIQTHYALALAHRIFELLEASGLSIDNQITAVKVVNEVLLGSRDGYGKLSLASCDAPNLSPSTPRRPDASPLD